MAASAAPQGREIVVGIDGSTASIAALRWAMTRPGAGGGRVRAVLVRHLPTVAPATSYAVLPHGARPDIDEQTARDRLLQAVDAAQAALGEQPPVEQIVVTGDPVTELAKAAADADTLVVGSHGRGALADVVLGSVAAGVLRHAACPVTVINPAAVGVIAPELRHAPAGR